MLLLVWLVFYWDNYCKTIDPKHSNGEKKQVLKWRNTLPKHVKSYVDNKLNPAKVSLMDRIECKRKSRKVRNF